MSGQIPYSINLDEMLGPLEFIDVQALADAFEKQWYNHPIPVNDCVVRLSVLQGEFHCTNTTRRTSSSTKWMGIS